MLTITKEVTHNDKREFEITLPVQRRRSEINTKKVSTGQWEAMNTVMTRYKLTLRKKIEILYRPTFLRHSEFVESLETRIKRVHFFPDIKSICQLLLSVCPSLYLLIQVRISTL
jgi:hypothetical protein